MINRLTGIFSHLERHEVRYVVMGGIAVVLYGVPRATFDLDLLIEAREENAAKLLHALQEAGFATALLTTPEDLLRHEITVFNDKIRIDVFTRTPGLQFEDAWERRVQLSYQGQTFWVVSKPDLLAAKRASGRPKDLEDVRLLELNAPNRAD